MMTTLNEIGVFSLLPSDWKRLLSTLGKTKADDESLSIITILDSNGMDDAIACLRFVKGHDKEIALYAVDCGMDARHLMVDQRSLQALDVSKRFANGKASIEELEAAMAAADDALSAASDDDAADAAAVAVLVAEAVQATAVKTEAVQATAVKTDAVWWVAATAARAVARANAEADARTTAWTTARAKQEQRLRKLCAEIDMKGCAK